MLNYSNAGANNNVYPDLLQLMIFKMVSLKTDQ